MSYRGPGVYRHFKGSLYLVRGIARHSETEEELVVYSARETGDLWVRPLSSFNQRADSDTPRFVYQGQAYE